MTTNRPQSDLIEWRINKEGKLLKCHPWIKKKNPVQLMPASEFEPTTSQSLSGSMTPRLAYRLNHSATGDW